MNHFLPAGQALENAPNVEQRPGRRWASSLYGWLSLGVLVLLGRGSGRNEAGMRASPAARSSAKILGSPCPVQGVSYGSSKCQTGVAIHKARSTTASATSTNTKAKGRKASQPVPKKLSTSITLVPKWRYVAQRSFLKAKVLPALRKNRSLPSSVIARQLDFRLCPSCLAVSSSWAPDKCLWTPGDAAGLQSAWGGGEAVLP